MANPSYELHPKVREHLAPRMSATALAEYLILQPDAQERVLHDCRFAQTNIVGANGSALRALRRYNCDPHRNKSILDEAIAKLTAKALNPETKPKARDEALRCAEAIKMFLFGENAIGTKGIPLVEAPHFDELPIEGVTVSVRPDFLVQPVNGRVGAGLIRVAKAPDPKDCKGDDTKRRREDHRREMARYMIALFHMLLEAQKGTCGTPDQSLSFVADVRLGERILAGLDHTARIRRIRAACRAIEKQWDTIKPRKSVLKKKP